MALLVRRDTVSGGCKLMPDKTHLWVSSCQVAGLLYCVLAAAWVLGRLSRSVLNRNLGSGGNGLAFGCASVRFCLEQCLLLFSCCPS